MIKDNDLRKKVEKAKKAALEVLLHNNKGPFNGFPRTAGWGYPEPYTRDLMISSLGILLADNQDLIAGLRKVLEALANIQTDHGHIPGLATDKNDVGAADTTPLFILAVGFFREKTGEKDFLEKAIQKAITWMEYQSSNDRGLVSQLPASDWRDEQWVVQGYCLFVNTIIYSYLKFFNHKRAEIVRNAINCPAISDKIPPCVQPGLLTTHKNFYAMCVFKPCKTHLLNTRGESPFDLWFDLPGNSLAILSGITIQPEIKHLNMNEKIISYVEQECKKMRNRQELILDLPPVFFPYITENDREWCPRYTWHGKPGEYQNGGIWPFTSGFYVAALVGAGETELAEQKLAALTDLVELIREPREADFSFGFNEWIRAQNGAPMGENWQSWSAAMYLYAARCVETNTTPFFDKIRGE